MTNSELASRLNSEMDLAGELRITSNVVRQWVGWKLLPKATIKGRDSTKGPIWYRDNYAYKIALRLARFRKGGLKSKDQLAARCYIDGWNIDIANVRIVLLNRVKSKLKSMNKRLTVDYSKINSQIGISAVQSRALQNQLGAQDERFKGTPFELTGDINIPLNLAALTGILPAYETLEPIIQKLPIDGELKKLLIKFLPRLASAIAGMAGSPDEIENSLLGSVENCSDQVFSNSQKIVRHLFNAVNDTDISKLAMLEFGSLGVFVFDQLKQLDGTEWPVMIFAALCHMQHNSNKELLEFPGHFI